MDYLLKSTICLTAFYGLYFFGFRQMSFHTLNRFYLLVSLALSLTIPLLNYERTEIVVLEPQPTEEVNIPVEEIQESTYNQATAIQQTTSFEKTPNKTIDWIQLLNAIYLLGVGLMIFVFSKNILTILYTIKKASASLASTSAASSETSPASLSHRKLKILVTKSQSNSSFFNYVFLNSDNLNQHEEALIIAHEGFHAQRLHTLDLMLLGILKAVFWFNPIVYFYQKSLKQIHEYEVDALMSATYDSREYAHLLLKLSVAPSAMIINQFSTKPLSERIQFLFKTPTKNMKKLLYFLSLPIIAVGVMAFAEEKVVRVYREKETNKISKEVTVKVYPLKINHEKNKASWTHNVNLLEFSAANIPLNFIQIKNYNGFHYYVNPNSLTIKMIDEVNRFIGKRFLALTITEQQVDSKGNLTKLGLAVKHLRTNQMSQIEVFDMNELREKGKNGAFLIIEGYDRNFKMSDISFKEGTKDLTISRGTKDIIYTANISSDLVIMPKRITYKVAPDKFNLKTLEKVKTYFAKEGFILTIKSELFDSKNNLTSLTIQINNGKEKVEKQIILNDLRHIVKSKNSKTFRPQRADESIVIEANKVTQEVTISYDNRWFDLFRKSGNFEILKVTNNVIIPKIDSSQFSFNTNVKVPKNKVDSFNIISNQEYLVEGRDYVVKNNVIFLNPAYKNTKIAYRLYMKPTGSIIYPELTKLNKVEFPDMRFPSKTPVFLAKNETKPFSQSSKSPSYFSKIKRNQDTLRTILTTNQLGKNPLVFINGEEYPSSILYRINPDAVVSMVIPRTNGEKLVDKYGEKAKDGIVRISTKKNVDFLLKNEREYQIALENIKNLMLPTKGKVKRVLLKDLNGRITEKVSIIDTKTGFDKISMRTDVGKKAIFFIDNVLMSEEEVNNYNAELFYDGYKNEIIEEKYPKEVKSADMIFNLKTKRN